MLLPLLMAAVAASVPVSGTYVGTTSEHDPVRIVVRGGQIVRATATVETYRCDPQGDLGGRTVTKEPAAPFRGRTFRFDAGPGPTYLRMTGTATGRTISGGLRVHGTIGTGDPCTSRSVRFTATRR